MTLMLLLMVSVRVVAGLRLGLVIMLPHLVDVSGTKPEVLIVFFEVTDYNLYGVVYGVDFLIK